MRMIRSSFLFSRGKTKAKATKVVSTNEVVQPKQMKTLRVLNATWAQNTANEDMAHQNKSKCVSIRQHFVLSNSKVGLCISNHVRIKIGHIQLVIALSQSNCMCVSHRILDNCAIEKLKVETLHDILHAQTLVLRSINTVERCDYIFMLSNSNDIENISEAQNLYGGINKMWM